MFRCIVFCSLKEVNHYIHFFIFCFLQFSIACAVWIWDDSARRFYSLIIPIINYYLVDLFNKIYYVFHSWIFVGILILFFYSSGSLCIPGILFPVWSHISLCSLISRQYIHHPWGSSTSRVLGLQFISIFFNPMHLTSTW